jgi:hypothetical protein
MHTNDFACMFNTNIQTLSVVIGQFLGKKLSLTDQDNRNLPSSSSHDSAINLMSGRMISTHGVNSDYGAINQKKGPLFFCAENVLTLVTAT